MTLGLVGRDSNARRAQAGKDPTNNWTSSTVKFTGNNGADLVALGGTGCYAQWTDARLWAMTKAIERCHTSGLL